MSMTDWPTRIAPDPTAVRRARARRDPAFAAEALRVAQMSPGGRVEHPIEVGSASEIEVRATSMPCPICWGAHRLVDHVIRWRGGEPIRLVTTRCKHCGLERETFFRVRGRCARLGDEPRGIELFSSEQEPVENPVAGRTVDCVEHGNHFPVHEIRIGFHRREWVIAPCVVTVVVADICEAIAVVF